MEKIKRLTREQKAHILDNMDISAEDLAKELGYSVKTIRRCKRIYSQSAVDPETLKLKKCRHNKMLKFANKKGFRNTSEAIRALGRKEFIKLFEINTPGYEPKTPENLENFISMISNGFNLKRNTGRQLKAGVNKNA